MKIWIGYGSEHSANLVIIGKFKSGDDASSALAMLEAARAIAEADDKAGFFDQKKVPDKFSDAMLDFLMKNNFSMSHSDPGELIYEFSAKREQDRVIITTEEMDISAFLKVLISKGAKVEVYSAHEHGGPHGR